MGKVNFKEANEMRSNGMTYEAIANYFGVSKQHVFQFMNNPAFKDQRKRKGSSKYENSPYYGFRNMFEQDEYLTIPKLVRAVFGYSSRSAESKLMRMANGSDDVMLSKKNIDNLLNYAGTSYEDFFKKCKTEVKK